MAQIQAERHVLFLVIIFLVLGVTSLILVFSLQTDPVEEVLKNDQLIRMLIVLEDQGEPISTTVLAYYPVSRRGALFDILGNTGAIWSSLGRVDRIAEVYKEKGIEVYKKEIETLTGMQIPFTAEISLTDFGKLTDLLEGLRVLVPYPVDVEIDSDRYLLPSGAVTLDGDKIQTYLTYSIPEETASDKQDRTQNAVVAFFAALNKNKTRVFTEKNFKQYSKLMRVNIDKDGCFRLFSEVSSIDAERLIPQAITGSLREVDGKMLLFPYYDGQLIKDVCKQNVSALVSSNEIEHSRIYVLEIQNGTTVQGLAKNTAALLQSVGYDVLGMVNADKNDYENTIIIDHIGNQEIAQSLAGFIRCENVVTDEVLHDDAGLEANSLVDFTLILGKDFDGRYVQK